MIVWWQGETPGWGDRWGKERNDVQSSMGQFIVAGKANCYNNYHDYRREERNWLYPKRDNLSESRMSLTSLSLLHTLSISCPVESKSISCCSPQSFWTTLIEGNLNMCLDSYHTSHSYWTYTQHKHMITVYCIHTQLQHAQTHKWPTNSYNIKIHKQTNTFTLERWICTLRYISLPYLI